METVREKEKEEKWFQTLHLQNDLKSHSIRGGISTMGVQIISFIMNIAQTTVLARLLLPEDYGLVAMVGAITSFVTIFKDMGLSAAVIQKDNINQQQVSAVFWVNILFSLLISLIIALLAPVLVYFYKEERLLDITLVTSLSMFITGLSLQHNALMKRQMKFTALSMIQLGSVTGSIITGVVIAWLGYGYWALVISGVVYPLLLTVALWIVCDWRPNFDFKTSNVRTFLTFGAGVTGFDLVNHFSRNMDSVFIGKFVGSVALGLYSKAYQLLMLPITQLRNPLNAIALPALSSLQHDAPKFQNFYAKYLFILAFFSMPIVIYLGVFSDEIILIVLGEGWTEAGYLFKLLAVAAFIQPIASTQGLVLITTGKVKKYFNVGLVNAVFMVSGFAVGVFAGGAQGVAIAQAVVVYALFIPFLYYCLKGSPVSVAVFLKEISFPFLYSLLSCGAMLYAKYWLSQQPDQMSPLILCAVGFIVGGIVYLGLMYLIPASKVKFLQILDIRSFLGKKK